MLKFRFFKIEVKFSTTKTENKVKIFDKHENIKFLYIFQNLLKFFSFTRYSFSDNLNHNVINQSMFERFPKVFNKISI